MNDVNSSIQQMKAGVALLMRDASQKALLWSPYSFGDTSLPIIADASGKTYPVYGLALDEAGNLNAVISLPASFKYDGVIAVKPSGKPIPSSDLSSQGTDAQWAVLCDCYQAAVATLQAKALNDSPQPWW